MAHIYVNSKLSISFLYLAGISILSQIIHKYSQVTEQIFMTISLKLLTVRPMT